MNFIEAVFEIYTVESLKTNIEAIVAKRPKTPFGEWCKQQQQSEHAKNEQKEG